MYYMFDIQLNERGQTCQVINSCPLLSVIYFCNYFSISLVLIMPEQLELWQKWESWWSVIFYSSGSWSYLSCLYALLSHSFSCNRLKIVERLYGHFPNNSHKSIGGWTQTLINAGHFACVSKANLHIILDLFS